MLCEIAVRNGGNSQSVCSTLLYLLEHLSPLVEGNALDRLCKLIGTPQTISPSELERLGPSLQGNWKVLDRLGMS